MSIDGSTHAVLRLDQASGFGPMRDAARTALGVTMFAAAMCACVELHKRIPSMDAKQLLDTLKAVTTGAAKSHIADSDSSTATQANAIQVIIHETGEVIELDRARSDSHSRETARS